MKKIINILLSLLYLELFMLNANTANLYAEDKGQALAVTVGELPAQLIVRHWANRDLAIVLDKIPKDGFYYLYFVQFTLGENSTLQSSSTLSLPSKRAFSHVAFFDYHPEDPKMDEVYDCRIIIALAGSASKDAPLYIDCPTMQGTPKLKFNANDLTAGGQLWFPRQDAPALKKFKDRSPLSSCAVSNVIACSFDEGAVVIFSRAGDFIMRLSEKFDSPNLFVINGNSFVVLAGQSKGTKGTLKLVEINEALTPGTDKKPKETSFNFPGYSEKVAWDNDAEEQKFFICDANKKSQVFQVSKAHPDDKPQAISFTEAGSQACGDVYWSDDFDLLYVANRTAGEIAVLEPEGATFKLNCTLTLSNLMILPENKPHSQEKKGEPIDIDMYKTDEASALFVLEQDNKQLLLIEVDKEGIPSGCIKAKKG